MGDGLSTAPLYQGRDKEAFDVSTKEYAKRAGYQTRSYAEDPKLGLPASQFYTNSGGDKFTSNENFRPFVLSPANTKVYFSDLLKAPDQALDPYLGKLDPTAKTNAEFVLNMAKKDPSQYSPLRAATPTESLNFESRVQLQASSDQLAQANASAAAASQLGQQKQAQSRNRRTADVNPKLAAASSILTGGLGSVDNTKTLLGQ